MSGSISMGSQSCIIIYQSKQILLRFNLSKSQGSCCLPFAGMCCTWMRSNDGRGRWEHAGWTPSYSGIINVRYTQDMTQRQYEKNSILYGMAYLNGAFLEYWEFTITSGFVSEKQTLKPLIISLMFTKEKVGHDGNDMMT